MAALLSARAIQHRLALAGELFDWLCNARRRWMA
jgi:hypothetical protein